MDPLMFSLFWVFGWVILLLVAWQLRAARRERRIERVHKERLLAMEKGIPLPELPDYEEPNRHTLVHEVVGSIRVNPRWPLGIGALSIMAGIGVSVALRLSQEDYHYRVWSFGLIPVFVGVGLMLHYWLTRPPQGRD